MSGSTSTQQTTSSNHRSEITTPRKMQLNMEAKKESQFGKYRAWKCCQECIWDKLLSSWGLGLFRNRRNVSWEVVFSCTRQLSHCDSGKAGELTSSFAAKKMVLDQNGAFLHVRGLGRRCTVEEWIISQKSGLNGGGSYWLTWSIDIIYNTHRLRISFPFR